MIIVNIILCSLLVSSILQFLTKKNPYITLNCGIWAFLGKNPKMFNPADFHILGVMNDERGGDAAGFLSGNTLMHKDGVKYNELVQRKFLKIPRKHPVVLGHSRKSSSGGKEIQYTQPFCVKNSSGIKGALIHNGTLYNEFELSTKYRVPDKFKYVDNTEFEPNDTQILAYILLELKDYSVLSKYEGSAALVWDDRTNNTSYIFKGASKKYSSGKIEEERPLYTYKNKNGIWVSSIKEPLWIIAKEEYPNIEEVPSNKILVVKNGVIVDTIQVSRDNVISSYSSSAYGYGYGYGNAWMGNNYTNDDNYYTANNQNNDDINESRSFKENSSIIEYHNGRYWYGSDLANGVFYIDSIGCRTGKNDAEGILYRFIEGVMIIDEDKYIEASKTIEKVKSGYYYPLGITSKNTIQERVAKYLASFSVYPVGCLDNSNKPVWEQNGNTHIIKYTGNFIPLFSCKRYFYKKGKLSNITELDYYKKPECKTLSLNSKCEFNDGGYYALKSDPYYIIQVIDASSKKALDINNEEVELMNPGNWEKIDVLTVTHRLSGINKEKSSIILNDSPGEWEDDSHEDEWEDTVLQGYISSDVSQILESIEKIETNILNNSDLPSAVKAQEMVDNIRISIDQSCFNNY